MSRWQASVVGVAVVLLAVRGAAAQPSGPGNVFVPRAVPVAGAVADAAGRPLTGPLSVAFGIYTEAEGGDPVWVEVQTVTLDARGRFTAWLGATGSGLPLELFQTGDARWLGIQPAGLPEQPRTRLLSVPYALKAADADTLGGFPAAAFVRADEARDPALGGGRTPPSLIGSGMGPDTRHADGASGLPPTAAEGSASGVPWMNTALGNSAGATTSGVQNTAIGYHALASNTEGHSNTAVGAGSLGANTTGRQNVAIGVASMPASTTGSANVAIGDQSLLRNTTGSDNTALGILALNANTTGVANLAVGGAALDENMTGYENAALGGNALHENVEGFRNTAAGHNSLFNTSGSRNVGLGYRAGFNATTGNDNVYIANEGSAGESGKIRIGTAGTHTDTYLAGTVRAAAFVGDGSGLTGLAPSATGLNWPDSSNTPLGFGALGTTAEDDNTAVGYRTMAANWLGTQNVSVGSLALTANDSGSSNVAVGHKSLTANTSGGTNTALGAQAMQTNTSGENNVAVGGAALARNTTGSANVAAGTWALLDNTLGGGNVAVGVNGLAANTTGELNVSIGSNALRLSTAGSRNVALGNRAGYNLTTGSDNIYIGNEGVSGENGTIYLGTNGTHTRTLLAGNVGIGTAAPAQKLHVAGTGSTYVNVASSGGNAGLVLTSSNTSAHLWSKSDTGAFVIENPMGTPRVTVTGDGKFGVGTQTPAQAFELLGVFSQYVNLWSTAGNAGFVLTAGPYQGIVRENVADGSLALENPNGTERLRIAANGYVGIGTAAPTHPLQLASGAHVTAGGAWTNASSRALKDRIAPLALDAARTALLALEPVTYVYKADPADPQVGFIAEDVPALVATTDRASLSAMDFIAIAIKVIQDQQRRISALETEARAMDDLRERIAALERLLAGRQR